jgi:hypothetical protein
MKCVLRPADATTMLRLVVSVLLLGISCSRSDRLGLTTFGEDCLGKTDFIPIKTFGKENVDT